MSEWTEKDIADAKAIRQLWPFARFVFRPNEGRETVYVESRAGAEMPEMTFPSLKPGESVDLDVILEAENG